MEKTAYNATLFCAAVNVPHICIHVYRCMICMNGESSVEDNSRVFHVH